MNKNLTIKNKANKTILNALKLQNNLDVKSVQSK